MDKYTITLPVVDRNLSNDAIFEITSKSSKDVRDGLEMLARYFMREMRYDGIQYEANEHQFDHVEYKGYVFTESAWDKMTDEHTETPSRLLGGCCFRHREFKDGYFWFLDWVWLHPYERRKGILTKHWPLFIKEFGAKFSVQQPLSTAMVSFLAKQSST